MITLYFFLSAVFKNICHKLCNLDVILTFFSSVLLGLHEIVVTVEIGVLVLFLTKLTISKCVDLTWLKTQRKIELANLESKCGVSLPSYSWCKAHTGWGQRNTKRLANQNATKFTNPGHNHFPPRVFQRPRGGTTRIITKAVRESPFYASFERVTFSIHVDDDHCIISSFEPLQNDYEPFTKKMFEHDAGRKRPARA